MNGESTVPVICGIKQGCVLVPVLYLLHSATISSIPLFIRGRTPPLCTDGGLQYSSST